MVFGLEHIAREDEDEEANAMRIFLSKQFSWTKISSIFIRHRKETKIDHAVMFGSATGMLITADINGALVSRRQTKTCNDEEW